MKNLYPVIIVSLFTVFSANVLADESLLEPQQIHASIKAELAIGLEEMQQELTNELTTELAFEQPHKEVNLNNALLQARLGYF